MPLLARRAAILGVGLIGGSLGLRWRAQGVVGHVVGFGRNRHHLERAVELGAIDEGVADLGAAVRDADLVVLCAPIRAALELAEEVARHAAPGAVLTDCCSTKAEIGAAMAAALARHSSAAVFIGGHPMAGSEHAGVESADPYLFEHAVWVLCPPPGADGPDLLRLTALVEATGAHVVRLEPERHDRRVAAISHLPQLAAVALAEAAGEAAAADPGLLSLAGGGFRDTTRIAASPAAMWLDILATNRGPVLTAIEAMQRLLDGLRAAIASGDEATVVEHFAAALAVRQRVPASQKGLLPAYHDLVVFVPDRPGVIGQLGAALGTEGINIQDIEILRLREGEGGTLRLGFAEAAVATAAMGVLTGLGYRVQRRS